MAKQTKISREELLQAPAEGELFEAGDRFMVWVQRYSTHLLVVLAIVLAIFAGIGIVKSRREAIFRQASDKLFTAYNLYEKALNDHPWASAERVKAMEDVTLRADEVIKEYPESAAARNALFLKGNALFFSGDDPGSTSRTSQAIMAFNDYERLAVASKSDFERAAALLALGYAYENMIFLSGESDTLANQNYQAAMENYERIITDVKGAGFIANEARNAQARLHAAQNRREQAIALYTQVYSQSGAADQPETDPTAGQRDQLMNYIKTLALQFTTGNTARVQLQRLGVDVDALDKELKSASK